MILHDKVITEEVIIYDMKFERIVITMGNFDRLSGVRAYEREYNYRYSYRNERGYQPLDYVNHNISTTIAFLVVMSLMGLCFLIMGGIMGIKNLKNIKEIETTWNEIDGHIYDNLTYYKGDDEDSSNTKLTTYYYEYELNDNEYKGEVTIKANRDVGNTIKVYINPNNIEDIKTNLELNKNGKRIQVVISFLVSVILLGYVIYYIVGILIRINKEDKVELKDNFNDDFNEDFNIFSD